MRDWKTHAVEAFFPVIFVLALEWYLFFRITIKDVEHATRGEIRRLRSELKERLEQLPPVQRAVAEMYVRGVHRRARKDFEEAVARRVRYKRSMEQRAALLIFFVALSVLAFALLADVRVDYRVLAAQTAANTLLIGAFQVFFYYYVGKKYDFGN